MIKIILTSFLLSFWFIHMSGMARSLRLNFKPFNCDVCLPVWVAIGLYWSPVWIVDMLLTAFAAGVASYFLTNLMLNLRNRQKLNA